MISPGPDFVIVLKQSFKNGRTSALYTSFGIACGILVHVLYCIVGVGYLLTNNQSIYNLFKIIGGLYLSYIGFKSILKQNYPMTNFNISQVTRNDKLYESFMLGLITNIFNPKATLFFLSLFALVIDVDTSINTQIFYGLWMSFITGLWFVLVSFFFTSDFSKIFISKYALLIDKIMGVVLVYISIKLILL